MHLVPNQTHRILGFFEDVRNKYLIEIMQKDFKTNMHRITVDNVVPKSLVFYVFGSVLNN
jgi:hypothetical protein